MGLEWLLLQSSARWFGAVHLLDQSEERRQLGEIYPAPTDFHEGLPGHHLQISIAQAADTHVVRKTSFFGASLKGWAL